jgi:hypothetical protein
MGYGGTILIPRSPHGELNIVRVIKSRKFLSDILKRKDHLEGLGWEDNGYWRNRV